MQICVSSFAVDVHFAWLVRPLEATLANISSKQVARVTCPVRVREKFEVISSNFAAPYLRCINGSARLTSLYERVKLKLIEFVFVDLNASFHMLFAEQIPSFARTRHSCDLFHLSNSFCFVSFFFFWFFCFDSFTDASPVELSVRDELSFVGNSALFRCFATAPEVQPFVRSIEWHIQDATTLNRTMNSLWRLSPGMSKGKFKVHFLFSTSTQSQSIQS